MTGDIVISLPGDDPLDVLAGKIKAHLSKATKADTDAENHRISAGQLLLAAKARIEAGGELLHGRKVKFSEWAKEHFQRSRQDIHRVMKIAASSNPIEALAQERAETRERVAAIRVTYVRDKSATDRPSAETSAKLAVVAVDAVVAAAITQHRPSAGMELTPGQQSFARIREDVLALSPPDQLELIGFILGLGTAAQAHKIAEFAFLRLSKARQQKFAEWAREAVTDPAGEPVQTPEPEPSPSPPAAATASPAAPPATSAAFPTIDVAPPMSSAPSHRIPGEPLACKKPSGVCGYAGCAPRGKCLYQPPPVSA